MTHNISVNAYRLSPERFEAGTSGSYGFERMALTFSEEWQGLSKTVTFFPPKSRPVTKVLTDGDAFDIPPEATAKSGEILFTVFGYRDGKRIYAHSGEMLVRSVKKGEGLPSEAPTPSEKEQILAFVTAIQEMIEAGKIKGDSPYVGENGNWFVGDTDTGVSATKLPHALTFTGAASGVYDGSEPVEVEIPEEGNKVFFQEAEPEDAETGDFWYVDEEEEGGGLLVVTVDANNKASHTAAEINTFVQSGGFAVLVWFSNVFHAKIITASKCQFGTMFNATTGATEWIMDVDASGKATFSNVVLASLKNPNAITFKGAVEETYDGSQPVEVVIPEAESVQADWSQSDETKPDYVKNRTHGVVKGVILPETSPTQVTDNEWMIPSGVDLTVGAEYTVKWNGVDYDCIGQDMTALAEGIPIVGLGALNAMDENLTGNNEPFVLLCVPQAYVDSVGFGVAVMPLDGLTEIVLSISGETVQKLDNKYIDWDSSPLMIVTTTGSTYSGTTSHTADEIINHVRNGGTAVLVRGDDAYYFEEAIDADSGMRVLFFGVSYDSGSVILQHYEVVGNTYSKTETLPYGGQAALFFTGGANASYNGKESVTIHIPEGGGGNTARIEKSSTDTEVMLEPNKLYVFPEMANLSVSFTQSGNQSIVQEYRFRFTSGATPTTLTLSADVIGDLSVEANKVYEVSILDGFLVSQSWEVS